ncbi:hypothetical protein SpiGrapes_0832 [Sphaerochaeta pleomorpha str. Grapes]|uniref:Uncharacterized protein n=1 Tax=Sphaerochaeta pleomorpha (strain ATCC BAA-1885 / DSM 22778 / Grapes) TaxID=158190 RepID=G8QQ83_SPHPG|nr:hypothetical protein [Sphaerochaeta pleomorpha]AEV28660.1 hypothetical protein SpiGrapes_0832 [Sphaerochaeta pleomorpha str. Grapes]
MQNTKALHRLVLLVLIFCIAASSVGLFSKTGGTSYTVTNQYGDFIRMYGDGLYSHDSYFKAPIFRASDATMLFLAVPLLAMGLLYDKKRHCLKSRIALASGLFSFTYYSAGLCFGVSYNYLLLLYIALFSASLFSLGLSLVSIDYPELHASITGPLPYRGIYTFLLLTCIALILAWLPDILSALATGRPLALLEVYTTEITYVLDMGIISPLAILCLILVRKRLPLGYVVLALLLTLCTLIGIMVPVQTLFQMAKGIQLTPPEFITKVASFIALALFSLYLAIRLFKSIR